MMLSYLFSNPLLFLISAGSLLVALTIHEFAHAWMADRLGDPTPKYQGRVTLNPLAHLDPMGTVAILLIGFGWGKPVQFDPFNLKDPKRDTALISFAGPASNLIVAVILSIVVSLLPNITIVLNLLGPALVYAIYINVMLAIFNLVPVYPLDGQKILSAFLPKETALAYEIFMRRYGSLVLISLLIPWNGTSPVSTLIGPIIDFVIGILL